MVKWTNARGKKVDIRGGERGDARRGIGDWIEVDWTGGAVGLFTRDRQNKTR